MADRVPPHIAEGVKMRALYKCEWCSLLGQPSGSDTEIHHRVTRARGGPHDPFNMVNLCGFHHRRAHAENTWPFLIFGAITRGVYRGPDEIYRIAYPFRRELSLEEVEDLIAEHLRRSPGADESIVRWHVFRARDYLALDAPRGFV